MISGSVRHLVLLVGTGSIFFLVDREVQTSIWSDTRRICMLLSRGRTSPIYIHACMGRACIQVHGMCDLESGGLDLAGTSLLFFCPCLASRNSRLLP